MINLDSILDSKVLKKICAGVKVSKSKCFSYIYRKIEVSPWNIL